MQGTLSSGSKSHIVKSLGICIFKWSESLTELMYEMVKMEKEIGWRKSKFSYPSTRKEHGLRQNIFKKEKSL